MVFFRMPKSLDFISFLSLIQINLVIMPFLSHLSHLKRAQIWFRISLLQLLKNRSNIFAIIKEWVFLSEFEFHDQIVSSFGNISLLLEQLLSTQLRVL